MDREVVEPLGNLQNIRVIDGNTVKTFKFSADLWFLDNQENFGGYNWEEAKVNFQNPVPVYSDNDCLIGSVNIYLEDSILVGDFIIDYSTPERLTMETSRGTYYPDLDYTCDFYDDGSDNLKVTNMYISGVKLGLFPTSDDRVRPI